MNSVCAVQAEYLIRSQLSTETHSRVCVIWVRRFERETAQVPDATRDERLLLFLSALEREHVEDWKRDQARKAVTAWFGWLHRKQKELPPPKVEWAADGSVTPAAALAALQHTLRLRRYSYRTEQTYLDWVRRFFVATRCVYR